MYRHYLENENIIFYIRELYYIKIEHKFICPFLRSGIEANRGVEFSYSTRKSKFGGKWGTEYLNIMFRREADFFFITFYLILLTILTKVNTDCRT